MTILTMSLGGAVLITVILLVRQIALYRLPKWTFLLLWGVALGRLLVPFTISSPVSIYTGTDRLVQFVQGEVPAVQPAVPQPTTPAVPGLLPSDFQEAENSVPSVPVPSTPEAGFPTEAVLLTGTALCAAFFTAAYLRGLRRFRGAVPADRSFLVRWHKEHPTLFPVQIRISQNVTAPLAYGLLRPVVLLPQSTNWADEDQLTYVLTHEYVHIRRGDMFWKLLLTAGLCIHWFNPLVWAMYLCANRDLELACDEAVVRILGLDCRKGYAQALLQAEEERLSPLCSSYKSECAMKERITAIMKTKKLTLTALTAALLLVTGVAAVFATSQVPSPEELQKLPLAVQSDPPPTAALKPDLDSSDAGTIAAPWNNIVEHPKEEEPAGIVPDEVPPEIETSDPQPLYPVNAKGHTYGAWTEADGYENVPDLIFVQLDSSTWGYLRREEVYPYSYPLRPDSSQEELQRYLDWYHANSRNPETYAEYSLYDQEETQVKTTCTFYLSAYVESQKLSDQALLARITQGNPINWTLYLGTAPAENIPHRIAQLGRRPIKYDYERELFQQWTENGDWRRNSKGQTYGPSALASIVGYEPDLVLVQATNGASGFIPCKELSYAGYQGSTDSQIGIETYQQWLRNQPSIILLPVYDTEYETVVGWYAMGNSAGCGCTQADIDTSVETLTDEMRKWGASEEEIAQAVQQRIIDLKQQS